MPSMKAAGCCQTHPTCQSGNWTRKTPTRTRTESWDWAHGYWGAKAPPTSINWLHTAIELPRNTKSNIIFYGISERNKPSWDFFYSPSSKNRKSNLDKWWKINFLKQCKENSFWKILKKYGKKFLGHWFLENTPYPWWKSVFLDWRIPVVKTPHFPTLTVPFDKDLILEDGDLILVNRTELWF